MTDRLIKGFESIAPYYDDGQGGTVFIICGWVDTTVPLPYYDAEHASIMSKLMWSVKSVP
jgi:hypothetical protein